jgi:nucleoside-diphosphate-sugar epimerase
VRVTVFGANGRTGRELTRQALEAGHSVVAVTRKPDSFPFSDSALTVARADVRDAPSLKEAVVGADAVLSTLGVPFSGKPIDTYSDGTRNIVAAMGETDVRRLVVVSSSAVYPTPNRRNTPTATRLFEPILKRTIGKTTYDDQRRMETILQGSDVDWTIVRPSGLFDLTEPTNYIAGEVDPVGAFTARADLAHYLLALASDDSAIGRIVMISTTENTPTMWQMIRSEAFKKDV